MRNQLKSDISKECTLEEFEDSMKEYLSNMTKGKMIIKPHMEQPVEKLKEEKLK